MSRQKEGVSAPDSAHRSGRGSLCVGQGARSTQGSRAAKAARALQRQQRTGGAGCLGTVGSRSPAAFSQNHQLQAPVSASSPPKTQLPDLEPPRAQESLPPLEPTPVSGGESPKQAPRTAPASPRTRMQSWPVCPGLDHSPSVPGVKPTPSDTLSPQGLCSGRFSLEHPRLPHCSTCRLKGSVTFHEGKGWETCERGPGGGMEGAGRRGMEEGGERGRAGGMEGGGGEGRGKGNGGGEGMKGGGEASGEVSCCRDE